MMKRGKTVKVFCAESREPLGEAAFYPDHGWRFIPADIKRRFPSFKFHTSLERCIPYWLKKPWRPLEIIDDCTMSD